MDRETFNASIVTLVERKPFKPFTVAMLNGDRFEVDHVRALALGDGAAVYLAPGNVPVIFDHEGVNHIRGDIAEQSPA